MRQPSLISPLQPSIRALLRSPLFVPARRYVPIRFVGRSVPVTNTTGLNANLSKTGANLAVGDRQIIIHITTSTPTTPTGYTQLAQITHASFPQILTVWGKPVVDVAETTGTITLMQAVSGVQQAVLLALRGATSTPVVDVAQAAALFQDTHNPQPMVGVTAASAGLALAICCPAGTTGGVGFTASAGWTVPIGSIFNSRLGFAYRTVRAGEAVAGTITCDNFADGASKSWSKATLTFKLV
jgi:hypothetical protein